MSNLLKRYGSTAAILPFILFAGAALPAQAQDASAEAPAQLGDVIVTAQRREERLSTVPVAVTAFQGEELERLQISDIHDLTSNAPAITSTSTPYSKNDLLLSIRGVAPGGVLANVDPAAGVYMDGVYLARSQGSNFALVDIRSAEILRGPQGTLFGRNTIAGALNITTNQPTDEFGGSLTLGAGNYNDYEATGIINGPLIADRLAGRLVVKHSEHDGYGEAINTGGPLADENASYVRGSLKADVTSNITANFTADYFTSKEHSAVWKLNYLDPTIASPTTQALLGPYITNAETRKIRVNYNPEGETTVYDLNGTVTADLGAATLKSITAYRNIDFSASTDSDGSPNRLLEYTNNVKGDQFTEELQLSGQAADDRLTWLTGVYYFTETNDANIDSYGAASLAKFYFSVDNTSMSAFAQASYEIFPKVRATAGLRYVHDERNIEYPARIESYATPPVVTCTLTAQGLNQQPGGCFYAPEAVTFNYMPWTLGLDYQPTDSSLIYAKVTKGFRSGGFQQPLRGNAASYAPFNPEDVLTEELGAKFGLLDRRLTLDLAIYHTDYDDIQQNSIQQVGGFPIIGVINAGQAEINGGELSFDALISDLRLGGSIGLIDAEFTGGPYKGSTVPTVTDLTWAVRADYPIDFQNGTLNLHVDYDYRSENTFLNTRTATGPTTSTSFTPAQIASFTQDGYGLLNARVSYTLTDSDLTFALWGKNLTDEYYAGRSGTTAGSGWNTIAVGDPLTFGAAVTYKFGS